MNALLITSEQMYLEGNIIQYFHHITSFKGFVHTLGTLVPGSWPKPRKARNEMPRHGKAQQQGKKGEVGNHQMFTSSHFITYTHSLYRYFVSLSSFSLLLSLKSILCPAQKTRFGNSLR